MKKYKEFCGYYYDLNQHLLESFNLNLIQEGLIKSVDYESAIKKIDKLIKKYKVKGQVDLYLAKDRIEISFYEKPKSFYPELIKLINNLGYYISSSYVDGEKIKDISNQIWKNNKFNIFINKKYDSVDGVPEKLYHVTQERFLDKIKKQGLKPKSKNVIQQHPERIYLFGEKELCKEYIESKKFLSGEQDFLVLEVDTKFLQKIKLYIDPKFMVGSKAYYTYDNIPPNTLSVLK